MAYYETGQSGNSLPNVSFLCTQIITCASTSSVGVNRTITLDPGYMYYITMLSSKIGTVDSTYSCISTSGYTYCTVFAFDESGTVTEYRKNTSNFYITSCDSTNSTVTIYDGITANAHYVEVYKILFD